MLATNLDAPVSSERTHVFLLPLSAAGAKSSLPPTEIERAEAAALVPALRTRFLARRQLLRRAAGKQLGINPGDILIARDANGAPRVTSARAPIFVSLASRGDLVAIGISDRPIGVDVEVIEADPTEPAWNILHESERRWLSAQRPEHQNKSFLALWCVKEAYLKALGLGLRREPAEIAVSLEDWERVRIEDAGRPAALDAAWVTRSEAHDTPATLASVVLAR